LISSEAGRCKVSTWHRRTENESVLKKKPDDILQIEPGQKSIPRSQNGRKSDEVKDQPTTSGAPREDSQQTTKEHTKRGGKRSKKRKSRGGGRSRLQDVTKAKNVKGDTGRENIPWKPATPRKSVQKFRVGPKKRRKIRIAARKKKRSKKKKNTEERGNEEKRD